MSFIKHNRDSYQIPVTLIRLALTQSGSCCLRVSGNSMLPHVQGGDVIKIVKRDFDDLYPGQIIAYVYEEQVLLHRIKYKVAGGYITQGDNNVLLDQPVTAATYLGVATMRLLANGKRQRLPMPGRPQVSNQLQPQVRVYLPDELHAVYDIKFAGISTFALRPLNCLKITPIYTTIGITPLGLSDEKVLIRLLQSGYYLHLICFANFGPDGVKGISVSRLRTTVRLQMFNYQLSETDSVISLLSYLNGLINGATSTNN